MAEKNALDRYMFMPSASREQESYFHLWVLHGLLFLEDVEYLDGGRLCQDYHVLPCGSYLVSPAKPM